jgi:hypothetical protein
VQQGWQGVEQTFRRAAFRFCRPMVACQAIEVIGCAERVWIVAKDAKKEW